MKDVVQRNVNYHHENFFSGAVVKNYKNQSMAKAIKIGESDFITTFCEKDLNIIKF